MSLLVGILLLGLLGSPFASGKPLTPARGNLGAALATTVASDRVQPARAEQVAAAIDTGNRATVEAAYFDVYQAAVSVAAPMVDPAAVAACEAGTPSPTLQEATLDLVNYFRAMSQVNPVTFDPALSAKAQQAALMMYANQTLDHTPPASWSCYTAEGADAAGRSNLGLGYAGAEVIHGYMNDPGPGNTGAGHRWWLQRPSAQVMGSGMVGTANALWVVGTEPPVAASTYTGWPSAGFFPAPLEPGGRWSFTAWDPDYDLSQATVTVTDDTGAAIPATAHPVESWGSLVFEVGNPPNPVGTAAATYTVTITNILVNGAPVAPHTYAVSLFNPIDPEAFTALSPPTITGVARVGSTLVASPPHWSEEGVTTTYQWLRNSGQPIAGAQTNQLTLTTDDLSDRIFVRAIGRKGDRPTATADSALTAEVGKIPATLTLTGRSPKVGQITFAVKVSAPGEAPLGGTAWVKQGTTLVRNELPIIKGQATLTATKVKSGTHTYTVFYRGTTRVASATKSIQLTTKAKAKPTIALTGSSTSGKVKIGIKVTARGEPPLGGSVSVKEGTKTLKSTLTINKGQATFSASNVNAGKHTYTVSYRGTTEVSPGSAKVTITVRAPVKLVSYQKCADLQKIHPHGVGRSGATDKTSGTPVTTFLRHTALYQRNDGQSPKYTGERDLDRDNDGIACEKK